jgi:hypothetical protein
MKNLAKAQLEGRIYICERDEKRALVELIASGPEKSTIRNISNDQEIEVPTSSLNNDHCFSKYDKDDNVCKKQCPISKMCWETCKSVNKIKRGQSQIKSDKQYSEEEVKELPQGNEVTLSQAMAAVEANRTDHMPKPNTDEDYKKTLLKREMKKKKGKPGKKPKIPLPEGANPKTTVKQENILMLNGDKYKLRQFYSRSIHVFINGKKVPAFQELIKILKSFGIEPKYDTRYMADKVMAYLRDKNS